MRDDFLQSHHVTWEAGAFTAGLFARENARESRIMFSQPRQFSAPVDFFLEFEGGHGSIPFADILSRESSEP
jgi:hypothetical protein